jgi:hypothetical protein
VCGNRVKADINRTDLSKLEKGASYPGLEIIAHLAIVCRRVESHRAAIGVAIRGNLRRPINVFAMCELAHMSGAKCLSR